MLTETRSKAVDTPEGEESDFYQDLAAAAMGAYWEVIPRLQKPAGWVHLWKRGQVESLLFRAAQRVSPAEAERRVLLLSNPQNPAGTTNALSAAVQLVLPGEVAPPHRHTMAAIRLIISGQGAFTDVEGERIPLEPNDLVLTPSWTWHSHENPSAEPVYWLDGLDGPLVRALRADLYEPGPEPRQELVHESGYTRSRSGNGLVRLVGSRQVGQSWPVVYRWSEVCPELMRLADSEGSPFEGVMLDYVNPNGSESTLPTINCRVQLLRPGLTTTQHRHMGSVIYRVIEGRGRTILDDTVLEWEAGDIFCVPAWTWRNHQNASEGNAMLFSYTDAPVLKALGLYREEIR